MPKDTRNIARGVQVPQEGVLKTFVAGQEDELEEVLTKAQVERLTADGTLTGDWKGKAASAAQLNARVKKTDTQPTAHELSQAGPRTHEGEPVKDEPESAKPHAKHK